MVAKLIFVAIAYLLGAIPFGYLLVKYIYARGEDVRASGSGGTGATNVTRKAGRTAGLLTYTLDVGKGVASVALMRIVADGDYFWIGAAGIAAIAGHIFPIFLGFRGGKGVATGVGIYLLIAPFSVLGALLLWAVTVYFTRYVSLASLVGAGSLPLLSWLIYGVLQTTPHTAELIIIAVTAFALILFAHRENVRRLIRGEEKRFGVPAKQSEVASGSRS